jgi:sec-independent protein translocase protein TatC
MTQTDPNNLRRRRVRFLRRRKRKQAVAAMTMMEHLGELRTRIVISAIAFVVMSSVAFIFYEPILSFFREPLCEVPAEALGPNGCRLTFFRVTEGFLFRLKMTALVGLALASPVWLYQLYAFIVPALTPKEKRYTWPFIVSSVTLFIIGAGLAYLALPTGVRILLTIAGEDLSPLLGAGDYLNFVGFMLLGFGVAFEMPLILLFLGLADIISIDQLRRQRRVAIVAIALLSAIVTPSQDPYTMLMLAIPLYGLYELTILVLRLMKKREPVAA